MDKAKILRLCNEIEMIMCEIYNTGHTVQDCDYEAVDKRLKAIVAEISTPPKSNADRIRQMTDEELAEWFAPCMMCNICDKKDKPYGCDQNECKKYALVYMKKEVSEDAGND